ncbi:Rne/Rng family ribonuclease [Clostridium sp. 'deep sea']|uniref:Rne/Rng family ribonuclease n=1 Tax=Clostridium sp. 'deep sea' TaxID=2779445 RepID=UPI00189680F6|nr:Rne/Rng family ribonuclease [Clostridium sp. 'deep sea']QOR36330.1 Rne/Rng family ribonuclease [Clostridium sp. 'deep sea']
MGNEIVVNVNAREIRLALMENGNLQEIYVEKPEQQRIAGNIYKGKVINVLPGMQAAFIDIGLEKNAYLYVSNALPIETVLTGNGKRKKKRKRINEILHPNQSVIVQITKEPIGTKGARITSKISLPGRYMVLTPMDSHIGISHRVDGEKERKRLRKLANEVCQNGEGLIVRTAANGVSNRELKRDYRFLKLLWESIKEKSRKLKAPALLHHDADLIFRSVRDFFGIDIDQFIIDDSKVYKRVLSIASDLAPDCIDRVFHYTQKRDIFDTFGVETEINKALKRKVWLKCGGYLIIDRTEAMTVIDVNTGKFVGKKNLADTILKTNLEAATEIARQLRLRDIGGIIIIDFIDMETEVNQMKVLTALDEAIIDDRAQPTVLGITSLGLVEMTRKKVSSGLSEIMQKNCPYCEGSGRVISEEAMCSYLENEIKKYFSSYSTEAILIEVNPLVAAVLIGSGGSNLNRLEKECRGTIFIRGAENRHVSDWTIISAGTSENVQMQALPVSEGDRLSVFIEEQHQNNPSMGIARVNGYVLQVPEGGNFVGKRVRLEVVKTNRTYGISQIVH